MLSLEAKRNWVKRKKKFENKSAVNLRQFSTTCRMKTKYLLHCLIIVSMLTAPSEDTSTFDDHIFINTNDIFAKEILKTI